MRTASILTLGLLLSSAPVAFAGGDHAKGGCKGDIQSEAASMASRGWIGLETDKDASGAYVVKGVVAGSPAEKAGFQKGDVLLALNGIRFAEANQEDLKAAKKAMVPGKQVAYTVKRAGAEKSLTATMVAVPRDVLAKWVGEHVLDAHASVAVAQN